MRPAPPLEKVRFASRSGAPSVARARPIHTGNDSRPSRRQKDEGLLTSQGQSGYTTGMKTAISIPDDVFEEAERLATELQTSRSQLYSRALQEFVARHA